MISEGRRVACPVGIIDPLMREAALPKLLIRKELGESGGFADAGEAPQGGASVANLEGRVEALERAVFSKKPEEGSAESAVAE